MYLHLDQDGVIGREDRWAFYQIVGLVRVANALPPPPSKEAKTRDILQIPQLVHVNAQNMLGVAILFFNNVATIIVNTDKNLVTKLSGTDNISSFKKYLPLEIQIYQGECHRCKFKRHQSSFNVKFMLV